MIELIIIGIVYSAVTGRDKTGPYSKEHQQQLKEYHQAENKKLFQALEQRKNKNTFDTLDFIKYGSILYILITIFWDIIDKIRFNN